ncbi:hypothetical protein Tco_0916822 [Tanacetum coccineum]
MKGRLWSWMELVLALQVKDNQFSEPHTWDHNESGFLLSLSVLCQILFVFREALGLSNPEVFPTVDKVDKSILSWRGRKSLVVVDWRDLKSISECVFSKVEPLLIQLTLVTPVGSVIANSSLKLLIDSCIVEEADSNAFPIGTYECEQDLFICVGEVGVKAGACSTGALTSAIISAQSHTQKERHATDREMFRCVKSIVEVNYSV